MVTSAGNPAKEQYKIRFKHGFIYQSYDSIICVSNTTHGTVTLGRDWDYSSTTRKYLYAFLNTNRKDILAGIASGKIKYDKDLV